MAKVTVSGICLKAFDDQPDRTYSLADLHALCLVAGLMVEPAQVYAGVQSLASTAKCDRGPAKQTWCKLGTGRGKSETAPRVDGELPVPRKRRASSALTYDVNDILARLAERFGPGVCRPKNQLAYCLLMDGGMCFEDLVMKATQVLGSAPASWFTYRQGPNLVVGFLRGIGV